LAKIAMAIMNHSDPHLTMRVYTDERQLGTAVGMAPRFSVNDPSDGVITLQEGGLVAGCIAAVVD
jgi:hypothetical protein